MAAHGSYPAPDGGWGWAVVASSCLGQLVFAMICRSNGVFYLEYLAKFQQSATVTSWVFALMMTMWSGLGEIFIDATFDVKLLDAMCTTAGPVTTMLCAKFTCRTVSSWGAVLMVIGLMGSAFAPHIGLIYVTSGILGKPYLLASTSHIPPSHVPPAVSSLKSISLSLNLPHTCASLCHCPSLSFSLQLPLLPVCLRAIPSPS